VPATKKTVRGYSAEQAAAAKQAGEQFAGRTPEEILDALFPDGMKIGGQPVIPLSVASYTFLEKLRNPITKKDGLAKMKNEQLMELCFVLTHPVSECRELHSGGADAWRDAYWQFGENLAFADMQEIGFKIGAVVAQAMATVMPTQPKKKADAKP